MTLLTAAVAVAVSLIAVAWAALGAVLAWGYVATRRATTDRRWLLGAAAYHLTLAALAGLVAWSLWVGAP